MRDDQNATYSFILKAQKIYPNDKEINEGMVNHKKILSLK